MALTCGFTLTILKYKTIRLRFSIGIWTMHSYADDPEPTHKVIIPTSDIFWNYFFPDYRIVPLGNFKLYCHKK